jgi:hypothetical protein
MRRIRLYTAQSELAAEVAGLLREAGCGGLDADFPDELRDEDKGDDGDDGNEDVLLVILRPDLAGDNRLDEALREAAAKCFQIVGIWPEGSTSGAAPASMKKYGFAQVPWDAEALRHVICSSVPDRRTPQGQPEAEVQTKRNTC